MNHFSDVLGEDRKASAACEASLSSRKLSTEPKMSLYIVPLDTGMVEQQDMTGKYKKQLVQNTRAYAKSE